MDRTRVVALLGAILAILLLVGCGKKDHHDIGPDFFPPQPYPIRSSPENAVLYYKAAWENRDSTRIDSVIASGYAGTSTGPGGTLTFTKADEALILKRVQEDTNLSGVSIYLGPTSTWIRQTYVSDPPEWVALQLPYTDVRLYTSTDELVANAATFMEFKLEPTTPAPTSPTDTLWSIVRWTEISN